MQKFNLYISSIPMGSVDFSSNPSKYYPLDKDTGEELPVIFLEDAPVRVLAFDLTEAAKAFHEYSKIYMASQDGELTSLENGKKYIKEGDYLFGRECKFPIDVLFHEGEIAAFIVCYGVGTVITLVREGLEHLTPVNYYNNYSISKPEYTSKFLGTFMVKMRDGIHLATHVWLPKEVKGAVPVIFMRSPYNALSEYKNIAKYVRYGYAVVTQDVRGREKSEGTFILMHDEINDGDDSLTWIGEQSWCDGNVGMYGGSYSGFVQMAAAASNNPVLKCLTSMVTGGTSFWDVPRRGGMLMSSVLPWLFMMSDKELTPESSKLMKRDDWDEVMKTRPLSAIPEKYLGKEIPSWTTSIKNETLNEFWEIANWWRKKDSIKVPALIQSGWFDDNFAGTQQAWDIVSNYDNNDDKFLLMGPWFHSSNTTRDIHGQAFGNSALKYDTDVLFMRWMDSKLKGYETGIEKEKRVCFYMLGANEWRYEDSLPPADYKPTEFYLSDEKELTLDAADVAARRKIEYTYNPMDEAPRMFDPSENEISVPGNYKDVEKRSDVLVFDYEIENEFEICGDVFVEFYAASDAVDTDFVVRLLDVDKDGNSIKMSDGLIRAKFRNGYEKEEFLTPGKVEKYTVRMSKVANRFLKGHKMRFHITSSAKGYIVPNYNNGKSLEEMGEPIIAHQSIYIGGETKSKVIVNMKYVK